MIPISKNNLGEIHKHALDEYPYECCGIVIGFAESKEKDILFRCTNIQNLLHETDPKIYPRDAKTAYNIDPKELVTIFNQMQSKGMILKTFYHSHPDHDAYFSDEDKSMALFDGEPAYPDANYLVVSVYNKLIRDEAWFEWDSKTGSFEKKNISHR